MVPSVSKEMQDHLDLQDQMVHQGRLEDPDRLVPPGRKEPQAMLGDQVYRDLTDHQGVLEDQDLQGLQDPVVPRELQVVLGSLGLLELTASLVPQDQ